VLLITGLILLGGRPSKNVAAAYRFDPLPGAESPEDVGETTPAPVRAPGLLGAFCTQVGFAQLVSLGDFTAVSVLESACVDGHSLAVRALCEAGLQNSDGVIRLKSVVALRGPIAHLRRRDAEMAGTCASALLANIRTGDEFVISNAIIALGDIAIRFSPLDGPFAAHCVTSMTEAAFDERGLNGRLQAVHTLATVALRTKRDGSGTAMQCVILLEGWGLSGLSSFTTKLRVVEMLTKIAVGARDAADAAEGGLTARCIDALTGRCLEDSDTRSYTTSMIGTVVYSMRLSQARLMERCVTALSEKACCDVYEEDNEDEQGSHDQWTGLGVVGIVAVRMAQAPSNGVFDKCVSVLSERGMHSSSRGVVLRTIRIIVKVIDDVGPINTTLASTCFQVLWSARWHEDFVVRSALQSAYTKFRLVVGNQ